uniref:F-box domain-containing protein n=1 Tax=Brassica campestris TaxID=3711 RepID=M4DUL8_BRACM
MYDEYRARYLRAREDTISKLPDPLLCQILSHLPTKDAFSTSVLSHRWKTVCLSVPNLDLDSSEFPDYDTFVTFIDKLLAFSRKENSVLYKVKLSLRKEDENDQYCVTRWIDSVANPKLNHLDVECLLVNRKFLEVVPQSLYIQCDTLVYLRLHRVSFGELKSVSLPCLKTMRLEHNVYASDASLELLISSCLVLEDLSVVRMVPDNVKVLRVRSQTLTSLHVDYLYGEGDGFVDVFEREGSGVFIDAPRLKYLKFEDDLSDVKVITNSVSLEKVNVAFVFGENDFSHVIDLPKRNMVSNFFNSISGVKEMKISLYTMEDDPSSEKAANVRLSSVPPCLLSSLEFVKIKRFNGGPVDMEVARYFLENTQVLKKLVLDFKCSAFEQGFYMLRDLIALPRRSSSCQILLC